MSDESLRELRWVSMSRLEQLTGLGRKTLHRLARLPHLSQYIKVVGLHTAYDAVGFLTDDFVKKYIKYRKK